MKHIKLPIFITAFLLLALALSACDGTLPNGLNIDSSDPDASFSDDGFEIDDLDDDEDDDLDDDSSDDLDDDEDDDLDDDSSNDLDDDEDDDLDDDDEVFTATVEAVDGNTVTINGQVFTADLENNLNISDFLTAGQTIDYTIDDDGNEIKIIIEGLGEIELEIDDDDDDDSSFSSLDDDDDEDEDDDSDHDSSDDSDDDDHEDDKEEEEDDD